MSGSSTSLAALNMGPDIGFRLIHERLRETFCADSSSATIEAEEVVSEMRRCVGGPWILAPLFERKEWTEDTGNVLGREPMSNTARIARRERVERKPAARLQNASDFPEILRIFVFGHMVKEAAVEH